MGSLQQFGIGLIQALQTMSPALDGVMNFFTFLGRIEFYIIFIPLIYWTIDKRTGFRALLVLIFIDFAGTTFKLLFHQPRPYWFGEVRKLTEEASYGIPSTHASDSLAVGGYLAYRVKKPWFWMVMVFILFFIGLSRLYLGAHFPHDVIFGWLIGAAVLWGFMKLDDRVAGWAGSQTLSTRLGMGFIVSLGIILIGLASHSFIAEVPDTPAWQGFASGARSISQFFTLSGAFFGSIAGYALMLQYARFKTQSKFGILIFRYLVGIIVLVLIYIGLDKAFSLVSVDETFLGYVLRYIRYAAITFWTTFGAPWVYLKTRLAEIETS